MLKFLDYLFLINMPQTVVNLFTLRSKLMPTDVHISAHAILNKFRSTKWII